MPPFNILEILPVPKAQAAKMGNEGQYGEHGKQDVSKMQQLNRCSLLRLVKKRVGAEAPTHAGKPRQELVQIINYVSDRHQ
jgi:hypothetical protein